MNHGTCFYERQQLSITECTAHQPAKKELILLPM